MEKNSKSKSSGTTWRQAFNAEYSLNCTTLTTIIPEFPKRGVCFLSQHTERSTPRHFFPVSHTGLFANWVIYSYIVLLKTSMRRGATFAMPNNGFCDFSEFQCQGVENCEIMYCTAGLLSSKIDIYEILIKKDKQDIRRKNANTFSWNAIFNVYIWRS